MDEIGVDATKGRDRLQSGGNVLKRGGTGGAIIRLGVLDHVDGNGENSGRYTYRVYGTNHGEASVAE